MPVSSIAGPEPLTRIRGPLPLAESSITSITSIANDDTSVPRTTE